MSTVNCPILCMGNIDSHTYDGKTTHVMFDVFVSKLV